MPIVFNTIASLSFLVSAAVVAGGVYVYNNQGAIVDDIKEQITKAATDGVMGGMGGSVSAPKAPSSPWTPPGL